MALLGSGFDPGVTSVFATYIKKHLLDRIETLDILDCNGGDHGQHFATNFNPEINIREVTAPARHYEHGEWVETPALSTKQAFDFDQVGEKNMYLMYHEELESLAKHLPEIERIRFWMTFGDQYLKHLEVLQNVGMTRIDPVIYEGREIVPLQFLKAVLPEPASLGVTTKGKTNIGDIATGTKDGARKTFYVYNVCDHEEAYRETGNQAVSYTTGVPAMIGAALMLTGAWRGAGGVQHRAVRSRSVHGHAEPARPALAGARARGAAAILTPPRGGAPAMATRAAGPGAFAGFDLGRVPSPAFVVDKAAIAAQSADPGRRSRPRRRQGAARAQGLLDVVARRSRLRPSRRRRHLGPVGSAARPRPFSRRGRDLLRRLQGGRHGRGAGSLRPCHLQQPRPGAPLPGAVEAARAGGRKVDLGLRLNPMHSEGEIAKYDPAQPHSRLGHPADQLRPRIWTGSTASTSIRCASRISRRCAGPGRRCGPGSSLISAG